MCHQPQTINCICNECTKESAVYQHFPFLQPQLLHPQAKLQWKRCANAPVRMFRPQAVVIGKKVYVGGGGRTENLEDAQQVFQYDTFRDEWSHLPPHYVIFFAMAQFMGNLITMGGWTPQDGITSKVYCFKEQSHKWEQFLTPMPTARYFLSVATTQSVIVAIGGDTGKMICATVEVYSSETSQWHTADPLPVPCRLMSTVTIANTCCVMGGISTDNDGNNTSITTVHYTPLTTLIQKATSPPRQLASHISVWKTLPDTPLKRSAAASLSGSLVAVGGKNNETPASRAVHIFLPVTNSWVGVPTGDLPEPCCACTAVQLSSNQMLVVGGWNSQDKYTNTVFQGSITI